LHHFASDLQILNGIHRASKVASAAIPWDPTHPLGTVDHSTFGLHDSALAVAPIGVATDIDVDVRAIRRVLSAHGDRTATQTAVAAIAWAVTTALVVMPGCGLVASSIVLSPIELGAATTL